MSSQQVRPARTGIFLAILMAVFLSITSLMNFYQTSIVYAAAIVVNSVEDVVGDDGLCTLREAITAANTDTASGVMSGECPAGDGADTIELGTATYTLVLTGTGENGNVIGDLDIFSEITLFGTSADTTILQAGTDSDNGIDRVLHVLDSGILQVENITIRYGQETVTSGFPPTGGTGAGIFNEGILTVTQSIIFSNTARFGGGLNSVNTALTSVDDSIISSNVSINEGGGIFLGGDFTIRNTELVGNLSATNGGGLYKGESARLAIIDSIFRENIAVGDGGGFYNRSSGGGDITVRIVNSAFYENEAVNGGGVYIRSGKTEIFQSAIYENTAVQGAGLYTHNTDSVDIENSTISGNAASGNGGGIYNSDSPTNLLFVTVSHNAAAGLGGGLYNTDSSVLFITNSIVANSVSGGDCALGDTTSGFGNGDFNIIEDASCFSVGVVDPMLGPLQDNGGATFTHALLPNSPAINANGPCQNFISYDQRGVSRPQGGGCDIGAFEFGQFSPNLYLPFIHE